MLENLKDYLSARVLLLKIEGTERISEVFSVLFKKTVLVLIFFSFLFFVSIALALWIGEICDSNITGFLVTGGIYLLVFIVEVFKLKIQSKFKKIRINI
jgi:hypothetical protein